MRKITIIILLLFTTGLVAKAQLRISPIMDVKCMIPFDKNNYSESAIITYNPGVGITYQDWSLEYGYNSLNFQTIQPYLDRSNGDFSMDEIVWRGNLHSFYFGRVFNLGTVVCIKPVLAYGYVQNSRYVGKSLPSMANFSAPTQFHYYAGGFDIRLSLWKNLFLNMGCDIGVLKDIQEGNTMNVFSSKIGLTYELNFMSK